MIQSQEEEKAAKCKAGCGRKGILRGFEDIIGHEELISHLQASLRAKTISHAYIFSGEDGSGKNMLAAAFAKTLLCEAGYGNPCNMCRSCLQFDNKNHPDLHYITHEKSGSIGVGEIREQLARDVSIRPYSSKYKIYIIDEAEKLTEAAQNALLKTIEEPPSYVVIMLLTNNDSLLLPTVHSRCMKLDLREIPAEKVKSYLMEQYSLPDYKAKVIAAYSQGNIGRAVEMASSDSFEQMNDFVLGLMKKLDEMEVYEIVMAIRDMSGYKENAIRLLDLMEVWYHDILILKATNDPNQIVYSDEYRTLSKKAVRSSYPGLQEVLKALEKAKVRLRANVNFEVAMELLILVMKEN